MFVKQCFAALKTMSGYRRMLAVYLGAQIISSGLASFVIPFFSNRMFEESSFSATFVVLAMIWFLFAVLSVFIDFYGNRHNLNAYYRIHETQYGYHLQKALEGGFERLQGFSVETVVSRLMQDSEMLTNIVLWCTAIAAMLFSFIIVFGWSMLVYPVVFLLLLLQSILAVAVKILTDNRASAVKGERIRLENQLQDLDEGLNRSSDALSRQKFQRFLLERRKGLQRQIYKKKKKEQLLTWLGESCESLLDVLAKGVSLWVLFKAGNMAGAVVLPVFTLQSTYRNQFLSIQSDLSSILQNKLAVKRLQELTAEAGDETQESGALQSGHKGVADSSNDAADDACVVEKLSLYREEKCLLDDVSLRIGNMEKVAIIGANGSGKTTLLRAMMGLYRVTVGKVRVPEIAYSPVEVQLFEGSLEKNLQLVGKEQPEEYEKAVRRLRENAVSSQEKLWEEQVNLLELSGGQQRLAAHYRALLYPKKMMILDEPTSALDDLVAEEMMKRVLGYTGAVIYVTHSMRWAKQADRILVMEDGKIAKTYVPEQYNQLEEVIL